MHEQTASGELPLNDLMELGEEFGDILRVDVKQRVYEVVDGLLIGEMVHSDCCGDD